MGKQAKAAALTKCRSGYIPCNKFRHRDAEYLFWKPGFGFLRFAFGDGTQLAELDDDDRDPKGRMPDAYLMLYEYGLPYQEGVWQEQVASKTPCLPQSGILFPETDGAMFLYVKKDYPSGDVREMLRTAARVFRYPDPKDMFLVGSQGTWERPSPKGARP